MALKYAVVGATGNVGREILQILSERGILAKDVIAIASSNSVGAEVSYGEEDVLKIYDLAVFDFEGIDIVLSSPGAKISKEYVPRATAAGAVVIDNTSQFRMDPDVPLVVPEVNPEAISEFRNRNIIANPNCSTIQLVVALKPLNDLARIRRVVVSTYQSVSGAGKSGMDELFNQTKGIYMNEPESKFQKHFTKQIAFNAIPQIDVFMEDGYTKEEWKMMVETKKILDPSIKLSATCVRIPAFIGHAEAVNIEFEEPITADEAREALKVADGIVVVDHRADEGYVTQVECAGEDPVYVSRIRDDITVENGLSMWVVADNLRKGAALNTVQIAELLASEYF
ncbi:MAG: aspartate-semialdehyde dehydrogenase [Rhodospirillaceae bacterium]|nr:aspartate-semialdehyde dehydrogenase [Rhodospirillaceae bacterium]OUT76190.1 MAG: aspartate-semialdehyde dehydrogenase [Rhodospirillaceae bacterium TMED23]|tara:strand:+ start:5206 stop:6225 length:1020 start_codon:yes stop_codon:yes gene_type:complete